jgi:hypothetical protein
MSHPSHFTPGMTQYPLYRRLDRPQGGSGWVQKICHYQDLILKPSNLQQVAVPTVLCQFIVCVSMIFTTANFTTFSKGDCIKNETLIILPISKSTDSSVVLHKSIFNFSFYNSSVTKYHIFKVSMFSICNWIRILGPVYENERKIGEC